MLRAVLMTLSLGLAGAAGTAVAADLATAAVTRAPARIVFQVNDEDSRKWHTVLANINNVQEELGKVEVAVVVIGPALGMLKADALTANKVQDAMSAGVRFVARFGKRGLRQILSAAPRRIAHERKMLSNSDLAA